MCVESQYLTDDISHYSSWAVCCNIASQWGLTHTHTVVSQSVSVATRYHGHPLRVPHTLLGKCCRSRQVRGYFTHGQSFYVGFIIIHLSYIVANAVKIYLARKILGYSSYNFSIENTTVDKQWFVLPLCNLTKITHTNRRVSYS